VHADAVLLAHCTQNAQGRAVALTSSRSRRRHQVGYQIADHVRPLYRTRTSARSGTTSALPPARSRSSRRPGWGRERGSGDPRRGGPRGEARSIASPAPRAPGKKAAGTAELNRQRRGRAACRLLRFGQAEASPVTWPAVVAETTEERKRPGPGPSPPFTSL
jgi:hypothetical protein